MVNWSITKGEYGVSYEYSFSYYDLLITLGFSEDYRGILELSKIEIALDAEISGQACDFCVGTCHILKIVAFWWEKKGNNKVIPHMKIIADKIPEARKKLFFLNFQELKRIVKEYAEKKLKELENKNDIFSLNEKMILEKLLCCLENTPNIVVEFK